MCILTRGITFLSGVFGISSPLIIAGSLFWDSSSFSGGSRSISFAGAFLFAPYMFLNYGMPMHLFLRFVFLGEMSRFLLSIVGFQEFLSALVVFRINA